MKVRIQNNEGGGEWRTLGSHEVNHRRARTVQVVTPGGDMTFSLKTGETRIANWYRIHPDDLAAVCELPVAGKAPKPDAIADARAAGAREEREAIYEEVVRRANAATYTDTRRGLVDLARWIDGRTT